MRLLAVATALPLALAVLEIDAREDAAVEACLPSSMNVSGGL
jgi:hypothetical protein